MLTEVAYTGHWYDRTLDAYITPTRVYDPSTGRFLSEDPAGFAADGPNLYRYAKNDPVNYRDPSGLSSQGNPLNNLALDAANAIGRNLNAGPARPSGSAFATVTSIASTLSSAAVSGLKSAYPTANSVIKTGLGLGLGALGSIPPSQKDSSLIREITPGSPIVPQSIENLPGVRGALENPNRYQVSNHGDLGYIVYDRLDGSAKYVSGDQYQTLYGAARQAENAAENAAGRAKLLTLTQEVLVTGSFIHETGRDLSIAAFGHDYLVEPNSTQSYTTDERLSAFRWATMPGGNSRQAKAGDEVLEFLQQVHKNSLEYVGDTHVYRILGPDGTTYKIGESAQGVRQLDGASIRGEQQVRALQRQTGQAYESEIIGNFPGKSPARTHETRVIETFIKIYGPEALPGNKTNR